MKPERKKDLLHLLVGFLLGAGYVALLLNTVRDLGYARDEGFYFGAATSYEAWFVALFKDPKHALLPATIDRYWSANSEHPGFVKTLFALSHHWLFVKWRWFAEEGTSFRFPGMVFGGVMVMVTYLWGRRTYGLFAGLCAAILVAMMPRVFYNAHLDCFDIPIATMWLLTAYAYYRSLSGGGLPWIIACGVLYGLTLNTKHNSWLLPGALLAHAALSLTRHGWKELKIGRVAFPGAIVSMLTLGPVVFYATWPWIWHNTGKRLADYASFHLGHEYYNMEFLGVSYSKPPFPKLYAWVMTIGTVPAITLLLFLIGAAMAALAALGRRPLGKKLSFVPATDEPARLGAPELLWVLSILVSYAPWLSSGTPIFGGTKHWITAYPFISLFAGVGFLHVCRALRKLAPERWRRPNLVEAATLPCVIAAPIAITLHSHPWGLSSYTPLVGGASGAATLGLNRSFWGYTTGAVTGFLNERTPQRGAVFVHDTAFQSFQMLVTDGRLRRDIQPAGNIESSSLALYHQEPHMGRVEYQIWVAYGTTTPAHIGAFDGVPVVWIYQRP
jgi:hypothetical protein